MLLLRAHPGHFVYDCNVCFAAQMGCPKLRTSTATTMLLRLKKRKWNECYTMTNV